MQTSKSIRVISKCGQRGEWAELVFMARAAQVGLRTLRTGENSARYDILVDAGGQFHRVQVKSTLHTRGDRVYVCKLSPNPRSRPYRLPDFDFVAAYVIPEDVWYIIPARLILRHRLGAIVLSPSAPGHKWQPYLEAWQLLRGKNRRRGKKREPQTAAAYHMSAVTGVTENPGAGD